MKKIPNNTEDKHDYKIKFFKFKTTLYKKNNYKAIDIRENIKDETYTCSVEDLIGANQIPEINKMFNSIDYIMRRQLVPNEKKEDFRVDT